MTSDYVAVVEWLGLWVEKNFSLVAIEKGSLFFRLHQPQAWKAEEFLWF